MKTTRNLLVWILAVLLVGCNLGSPTKPHTPQPTPDGGTGPQATSGARPTLPPAQSLAALLPSFSGLYWTPGLMVQARGGAVYVVAGLPCRQVIDLLSSGEWRLTKHVVPSGPAAAAFPALVLMELGDRALLLKVRDIGTGAPAAIGPDGAPVPTDTPTPSAATPSTPPAIPPGCQVSIEPLAAQQVEAHGVEEVQGQALGYPLLMGCMFMGDTITVDMFYEGPGDFRAFLRFDVPNSTGEHLVSADGLSLNVFHDSMSAMDLFAQMYTGIGTDASENEPEEGTSTEFEPTVEYPGKVMIQSLDPLAGEIMLDGLADPDGQAQSFRAGFRCDNLGR